MTKRKTKKFGDYIYVRVNDAIKTQIKERAENEGSNMTIWVRQLIMRELEAKPQK